VCTVSSTTGCDTGQGTTERVVNETVQPLGRVRPTLPADIPDVVAMVHELAAYENAADQCTLTDKQLHTALFGNDAALFGHVAEQRGQVVGFTLWFLNFSTWDGVHGIHLEDLYVRPDHRRTGWGRALLDELVEECVRNGYSRMEWSVLNWNSPAIEFYHRLGAEPMDGWSVYRLSAARLRQLAATTTTLRGEHRP